MSQATVIFVNQQPYRVWLGASHFQSRDLISGFDPFYFSHMAELMRSGLSGEAEERTSLGIRTIYGLAVEAFFALLFATLQAPQAPAAWLLLYQPRDLRDLIRRFEEGEDLPSKIVPKEPGSWEALVSMLLPIREADRPDNLNIVEQFGQLWERLAREFLDDVARAEFNSLKHGLRARPASPWLAIDGHEFRGEAHGSSFPMRRCRGSDVLVNIGTCSWSAERLCASLTLISASLKNLLGLLKNIHGETPGCLVFEIPSQEEFDAAKPVPQPLVSLQLSADWGQSFSPSKLGKDEALRLYKEISGPLEARNTPPNPAPAADG